MSLVNNQEYHIEFKINHRHAWDMLDKDTAVCEIHFNFNMLREHIAKKFVFFHCNSVIGGNYAYEELRTQISGLLSECAVDINADTFKKKAYIYNILDILISNFLIDDIKDDSEQDDLRMERVLQYIDANHANSLSVAELAQLLYIAPSSFSRYFKKMMNVNFIDYLNHVRLHYALQELCYTSESVTWIANNHGFSNASAFCKAFKEQYGISPMQYRKNFENQTISNQVQEKEKNTKKYLIKYADAKDDVHNNMETKSEYINCQNFSLYRFPWNKVINVGFAEDLLKREVHDCLLEAKFYIGFEKIRINSLFSKNVLFYDKQSGHINNFMYIDIILDNIMKSEASPIICLDNKEKSVLLKLEKQADKNYGIIQSHLFDTLDEFLSVLEEFLKHILQRYGAQRVSGYMFECWYYTAEQTVMGIKTDYVSAFEKISNLIKKYIPSAKVGGWGISSVEDNGNYRFSEMLEKWQKSPVHPDFISLYLFPYIELSENEVKTCCRKNIVVEYFSQMLEKCRKQMNTCGFFDVPIYVLEWNLSMSMRNYYNETCGKAAMMLKVMAMEDMKLEYAGYSALMDLSEIGMDTTRFLFGGTGVINTHLAQKPACHALIFYHQLKPYIIHKDKNCIISTDDYGTYSIICFNPRPLRYSYFLKEENQILEDEYDDIFLDQKCLEIDFKLEGVENGIYDIKERCVNKEHGSIMDEWIKFGKNEVMDEEDSNYLIERAAPSLQRWHTTVNQGVLSFKKKMEPNEICLLRIFRA